MMLPEKDGEGEGEYEYKFADGMLDSSKPTHQQLAGLYVALAKGWEIVQWLPTATVTEPARNKEGEVVGTLSYPIKVTLIARRRKPRVAVATALPAVT